MVKENCKRLGFEIPQELYNKLKAHNETAVRPINAVRVFVNALEEELKKEGA